MDNPIIILGGMGPQASLRLHQLLLKKSGPFHGPNPDDFPAILHASIPVPDFIASSDKYEAAVAMVAQLCTQLPLNAAGVIGMACNTAHLMVDHLPLDGTDFVSMVEAVAREISTQQSKRVGLLASPYTIKTGLYARALQEHSINVVEPSTAEQGELHTIISSVIAGVDVASLRERLSRIAKSLQANGADCILLGCTELPLVGVDSNLPKIDSLEVLADAMLEKYYHVGV